MFKKSSQDTSRPFPLTGAVLTGGESKRLGFNKAFAEVGGRPMVERVLEVLGGLFEEVIIVTLEGELYEPLGYPVYKDLLPGGNALAGIHTALSVASNDKSFLCACDMPFLNPRLIARLVELSEEADVVVPKSEAGLEPLHAVYSKSCLPAIEGSIAKGELKLTCYFEEVAVRRVEGEELGALDAEGLSFFNVNTAQDLLRAEALALKAAASPPQGRAPR